MNASNVQQLPVPEYLLLLLNPYCFHKNRKKWRRQKYLNLVLIVGQNWNGENYLTAGSSREMYMDLGMENEKRCYVNLTDGNLLLRNQFHSPPFITNLCLSMQNFYASQTQSTAADYGLKIKQSSSTDELLLLHYCISEVGLKKKKKIFKLLKFFGTVLV